MKTTKTVVKVGKWRQTDQLRLVVNMDSDLKYTKGKEMKYCKSKIQSLICSQLNYS